MNTGDKIEPIGSQPDTGHSYYENRRSLGSRFRLARFTKHLLPLITKIVKAKSEIHILDLGGARNYWWPLWESPIAKCCHVTVCNLDENRANMSASGNDGVSFIQGDARQMGYPDNSFDLVHSNSMIEHVGHWKDMVAVARETRRLAQSYFVQTPNFNFFFEPHFRLPFFHWMPEQTRAGIALSLKSRYLPGNASFGDAMELIQSYQLLDRRQMATLFPDAEIASERLVGLFAKSLIAVRQ